MMKDEIIFTGKSLAKLIVYNSPMSLNIVNKDHRLSLICSSVTTIAVNSSVVWEKMTGK